MIRLLTNTEESLIICMKIPEQIIDKKIKKYPIYLGFIDLKRTVGDILCLSNELEKTPSS